MRAKTVPVALAVLLLAAAGASGQSYTLKIKGTPAAGKSVSVDENAKVNIVFAVSFGGNLLMEEKKVINEEKQYTEKVSDADDKGPKNFPAFTARPSRGRETTATSCLTTARPLFSSVRATSSRPAPKAAESRKRTSRSCSKA